MGVIIGIIYGLYLKQSIALTIILLAILIFLTQKQRKRVIYFIVKRRKPILIVLISIIISFLYINFVNNKFNEIYNNIPKDLKSYATVVSEPNKTDYYYSYEIKIKNKKFLMYTNLKLNYGMYIYLEGEYIEPQEQRNYKGFSYKEYLKTKNIYGSIKSNSIKIIKENNVNIVYNLSNQARNKVIDISYKILPENTADMLVGILIGKRNDISEEVKDSFSKSNLSHVLAISGTHISYIILGITFVLTKSKLPRKLMYIITILILIFFMFITGFSPSVIRACIVAIVMILSKIFYRKFDILSAMAFSLLITLLYNPFSIKDIGLQLSYLGALGIILFHKSITNFLSKRINKKFAEMMAVTISAQILIIPIIWLNFNSISTIFVLSNLIAIPLVGIIILFGYVNIFTGLFSIKLAGLLGIVLNILIKILLLIAESMGKLPFASIVVTTPSIAIVIIYYIGVFYLFYRINTAPKCRDRPSAFARCRGEHRSPVLQRHAHMIILIPIMIIVIIITIIPRNLTIHFVDVGQRRLYSN